MSYNRAELTGWKLATIKEVATDIKSGLSRKLASHDIGVPVLRSNNIGDKYVNFENLRYWYSNDPQGADTANYVLHDGDVLVNFINSIAQIGKCCIYRNELHRPTIFTTNIMRARLNSVILPEFFLAQTSTEDYRNYVKSITKPAVNQASFTKTEYEQYRFLLPPISEQARITRVLEMWDMAIVQATKIIAAKHCLKRGLMQQLLTGKRRFKEFEGQEWISRRLGYFFHGFSTKNSEAAEQNILSCTKTCGIIAQSERFGKRLASADLQRYKVVKHGDLVYDPMLLWDASIGFVKKYESGVISPAYCSFHFDDLRGDTNFFEALFQTHYMRQQYKTISQGTNVRRRKAPANVFLNIEVRVPPTIEEQHRIAAVLDTVDREIALLEKQLEALKLQKTGLMQKLLTGQIRVKA